MIRFSLRRLSISPTEIHILCASVSLLSCIPLLFPDTCPDNLHTSVTHYAGITISISALLSLATMLTVSFIQMMKLNNTKALLQVLEFGGVWGGACFFFAFIAYLADVEAPATAETTPAIQTGDTLHPANEQLNGPASLFISIMPDEQPTETVAATPNLSKLENEQPDVLKTYLETSPRWGGKTDDDTFYSKPGHLVMVPPVTTGAPGLVHVCFRRLTGGDLLPKGYAVVKPGTTFPNQQEDATDLAVEVGPNQYLLLAWRGAAHTETMRKALNAAIAAVDARMQPLAEDPCIDTIQRMLTGRRSYPGHEPELRLSEPPSQEGTYQAEIYANPQEAGTLQLYIKNSETGETLRLLSCTARYSHNNEELFRHDIPGSVPQWARDLRSELNSVLPPRAPLFIISLGKSHQYFGAAFEVWFRPADSTKKPRMILRRCYRVQPYEDTTKADILPEPPDTETNEDEPQQNKHEEPVQTEEPADGEPTVPQPEPTTEPTAETITETVHPDVSDMRDDATEGEEGADATLQPSDTPAHRPTEQQQSRNKGLGTRFLELIKTRLHTRR